ncbi:MAG TPA: tetratricopeptide repeat protein, partial [Alphaproteobacteria bacterium]|nr:tetratricopeptide repeat protein [Alphaproteobacteria bacterium]
NYRAALDRFNEALLYKPGDAEATIGLAQTQEKMGLLEMSYKSYKDYLEILPQGPMAKEANAAIRRIEPNLPKGQQAASEQAALALKAGEDALAHNNYEFASQRLEEALRLDAQNPVIYFRLAQALQGQQHLDPARLYFQKYLELQPAGPFAGEAKREIGEINLILGKS